MPARISNACHSLSLSAGAARALAVKTTGRIPCAAIARHVIQVPISADPTFPTDNISRGCAAHVAPFVFVSALLERQCDPLQRPMTPDRTMYKFMKRLHDCCPDPFCFAGRHATIKQRADTHISVPKLFQWRRATCCCYVTDLSMQSLSGSRGVHGQRQAHRASHPLWGRSLQLMLAVWAWWTTYLEHTGSQ